MLTVQEQINAMDNPGPNARFCPHCGFNQGASILWNRELKAFCINPECRRIFCHEDVLTWGDIES